MTATRINCDHELTYTAPNSVSCASGTWTQISSVTLGAGKWLVNYGGAFAANNTGYRRIHIGTSSGAGRWSPTQNAVSGGDQTRMNAVGIQQPASATTYHLYAWQNSGSTLGFYGFIQAVRIA